MRQLGYALMLGLVFTVLQIASVETQIPPKTDMPPVPGTEPSMALSPAPGAESGMRGHVSGSQQGRGDGPSGKGRRAPGRSTGRP